jgi:hypothetical protein
MFMELIMEEDGSAPKSLKHMALQFGRWQEWNADL